MYVVIISSMIFVDLVKSVVAEAIIANKSAVIKRHKDVAVQALVFPSQPPQLLPPRQLVQLQPLQLPAVQLQLAQLQQQLVVHLPLLLPLPPLQQLVLLLFVQLL